MLAFVAVVYGSSSLAAGVYKWRDADGKLHFSDKPPAEQTAEKLEIHTAQDKQTAQRLKNMRREADKLGTPTEADVAKLEAERQERELAMHCSEARQKLNALLTSTRRQVVNEQGEREFIGEDERQAEIRAVEDQIAKACR
ncbi:MAG: DUF4124 domain-containing protein [Gammaproteobacteria bacterium]